MFVRDERTIYENESNTSPFRQRTFSTILNTSLCILLSLERKVFPVWLNISSDKEASQFPLEIVPNPNTSLFGQFFSKKQNFTYL